MSEEGDLERGEEEIREEVSRAMARVLRYEDVLKIRCKMNWAPASLVLRPRRSSGCSKAIMTTNKNTLK